MAVNRSIPSIWADDCPLVSGPQRMNRRDVEGAALELPERLHDSPLFAVHKSKENFMATTKNSSACLRSSKPPAGVPRHILAQGEAGVLPVPIPIGPKSIAWDAEEIAQWQQRCIDARRGVALVGVNSGWIRSAPPHKTSWGVPIGPLRIVQLLSLHGSTARLRLVFAAQLGID